ncbi:MAG: SdpI family protein [Lentisphaeria bacterium]|nr:SdpI family protein [Lentisphaeria bacterium]
MKKLVNKYVWLLTAALYLPVAAKCVLMWDRGRGAAELGARLPEFLILPLITTVLVVLANFLEAKIVVDADGTPQLRRVRMLTVALFVYIHGVTLLAPPSREHLQLKPMLVFVGIGVFFVLLGILMPTLKRNRVAGVRYSWTLTDPAVWRESNRVGGRYTIAMGIVLLVSTFIPQRREMIFSTFEIWAFIVYVVALTLHSRVIAVKLNPPE